VNRVIITIRAGNMVIREGECNRECTCV
jgi:hypothetical protein